MGKEKTKIDDKVIEKLEEILSKGKDAEVKTNKDGSVKILEVSKRAV